MKTEAVYENQNCNDIVIKDNTFKEKELCNLTSEMVDETTLYRTVSSHVSNRRNHKEATMRARHHQV